MDNVLAGPKIKTIRSIDITLETSGAYVHGQGYVSVEKPTYHVIPESGEPFEWTPNLHGIWSAEHWFIIEPEPSSTSAAGASTSEGGRRTRGKLRAKSRSKSRKKRRRKRRKSRRKSKGRKRRRKNLKKRTKRRR